MQPLEAGLAFTCTTPLSPLGPYHVFVRSRADDRPAGQPNFSIPSSMEVMARPSVAPSLQLRPCPRQRRNRCPPSVRRRVACSSSAADADVVDLFDAAKLTVSGTPPHRTAPLVSSRSRRACVCFLTSFFFSPGGQVRGERHGGRARLRPGVRPGHPLPRHAPSPGISHRHHRSHLVSPGCS